MVREFLSWWFVQLTDFLPERWRRFGAGKIDAVVIAPASPLSEPIESVVGTSAAQWARDDAGAVRGRRERADGSTASDREGGGASPRRERCAQQDAGPAARRRTSAWPGSRFRNGSGDAVQPGRAVLEPPHHSTRPANRTSLGPSATAAAGKVGAAVGSARPGRAQAAPGRDRRGSGRELPAAGRR